MLRTLLGIAVWFIVVTAGVIFIEALFAGEKTRWIAYGLSAVVLVLILLHSLRII